MFPLLIVSSFHLGLKKSSEFSFDCPPDPISFAVSTLNQYITNVTLLQWYALSAGVYECLPICTHPRWVSLCLLPSHSSQPQFPLSFPRTLRSTDERVCRVLSHPLSALMKEILSAAAPLLRALCSTYWNSQVTLAFTAKADPAIQLSFGSQGRSWSHECQDQ